MPIHARWSLLFVLASLLHVTDALAAAALQSFGVTTSSSEIASGLFASVGTQTTPQAGITSWVVMIDVSALATLPATLLVNFPDRTAVTLIRWRYQERGPGAFLWTGHGGDCSAVFTVAPIALHGTISCLNANYGVEQVIDGSAFRLNRYIGNPSAPIAKPEDAPPSGLPGAVTDQTPATPNNAPDTAIDILVLYSEATRFHFDPNGGNAGTVAFARHCVDITQQAMENSTSGWQPGQPAIATVNFVGAREVAGPSSPQLITDYLQYAVADPESVSLRNLYAADAVVYLVENGLNAYGVAAVPGSTSPGGTQIAPPGPGFAPRAVAVVQRNTAVADDTGTYPQEPFVFPHEFAHLIARTMMSLRLATTRRRSSLGHMVGTETMPKVARAPSWPMWNPPAQLRVHAY